MLSDRAIRDAIMTGKLKIRRYDMTTLDWLNLHGEAAIQPVSVDLTLGAAATVTGMSLALPRKIEPGEFLLGSTLEIVALSPSIVGTVHGKSTRARQGLSVHAAGLVDPGFHGQLTMEMYNMSGDPLLLDWGMPIAQISFEFLSGTPLRPYGSDGLGSHYQGQTGPTPARLW